MTTRVRRRRPRERRGLTANERFYLLTGHLVVEQDESAPFAFRDLRGVWQRDEDEARAAWEANREDLYAAVVYPGLIPWAAAQFDGIPGEWSRYSHLRVAKGRPATTSNLEDPR